jgi:hypothetical protein
MTIQDLAPAVSPSAAVEQTPDSRLARPESGDIDPHDDAYYEGEPRDVAALNDLPWRVESLVDFTTNDTSSPQLTGVPIQSITMGRPNNFTLAVLPM